VVGESSSPTTPLRQRTRAWLLVGTEAAASIVVVAPLSVLDGLGARLEVLDVAMPATEREKPPCCDEEGQPPVDSDGATALVAAVDQRRRRRR